jgi:hypothetical protein
MLGACVLRTSLAAIRGPNPMLEIAQRLAATLLPGPTIRAMHDSLPAQVNRTSPALTAFPEAEPH